MGGRLQDIPRIIPNGGDRKIIGRARQKPWSGCDSARVHRRTRVGVGKPHVGFDRERRLASSLSVAAKGSTTHNVYQKRDAGEDEEAHCCPHHTSHEPSPSIWDATTARQMSRN